MKLRSVLFSSVFGLGLALTAGQASAVVVAGSSGGTFSNLNNCDNSGSSQDCRIINTGNGNSTQAQWGSTSSSQNFQNPSTLTSVDTSFNTNTNANDVKIARLDWFNNATNSNQTPDNFSFSWTLTISFTSPNASNDTELFTLTVTNPENPPGDNMSGFTMTDLSNLTFNLNGVTVSDLKYLVEDGMGTCSGTDTSINGTTWFNCEENTASLYITADFTAVTQSVPEPATLAVLGAGLLGLGAVRRRRQVA